MKEFKDFIGYDLIVYYITLNISDCSSKL